MTKLYNVAVCGASGVVGRKIIEVLEERDFPIKTLSLFASSRSAGQTVEFKGEPITIQELTEDSLKAPIELAFFSAGGETSEKFAPIAAQNGVKVVDNSSAWRMDPSIPLVVPEVNPDALTKDSTIIANPNCSTIQSVAALAPLRPYGIKRVVYNTYQAVSGAGQKGIADLENRTTDNFPYLISDSVIPQIDVFLENGYTKEENKMIEETRKIFAIPELRVTATTVRVPIKNSHGVSINVELDKEFDLETVKQEIADYARIVLVDDPSNLRYPLQSDANDTDEVYVGRIRRDESLENGLNLWVVADNIRKGAATNSIQIAETLVKNNLI